MDGAKGMTVTKTTLQLYREFGTEETPPKLLFKNVVEVIGFDIPFRPFSPEKMLAYAQHYPEATAAGWCIEMSIVDDTIVNAIISRDNKPALSFIFHEEGNGHVSINWDSDSFPDDWRIKYCIVTFIHDALKPISF
jgi:hypothetical protein